MGLSLAINILGLAARDLRDEGLNKNAAVGVGFILIGATRSSETELTGSEDGWQRGDDRCNCMLMMVR